MAARRVRRQAQGVYSTETPWKGREFMDEKAAAVEAYESPEVETKVIISRQCN
ncbi:hypothetical protein ACIBQ0_09660 [Nocardia nova]|uniref:hypothetical protein n=1 Tax=Nocardia nova TaxID=37330 RepID=UPI00379225A6